MPTRQLLHISNNRHLKEDRYQAVENSGKKTATQSACWLSGWRHRYQRGRSGVRFPGRSNRTQRRQGLTTTTTFFRNCVVRRSGAKLGPATRYTLPRNTTSMMKILVFFRNDEIKDKFCNLQWKDNFSKK